VKPPDSKEKAPARPAKTAPGKNQEHRKSSSLPQFLQDLIACPPRHGSGVHQWLFKCARQLHAHRSTEDITALLTAAVDGCGRHVPQDEIKAAVDDAAACAWQPSGGSPVTTKPVPKWPEVNIDARQAAIIHAGIAGIAGLLEMSPYSCAGKTADRFIAALFPGNPLLCVGMDKANFTTDTRQAFRGELSKLSLIVPSPMSARFGHCKANGKESAHTLENTGPRHYLVTEFDSGTPDEQAALIWHLQQFAPLVMVLSSGGKSLHAWWNCQGIPDDNLVKFMRYAVSLGADPATWTRSQFVRLPGGWRADNQRRQEVFYCHPENGRDQEQ